MDDLVRRRDADGRARRQLDRLIAASRHGAGSVGGLLPCCCALVGFFSLVVPATFPRGTTLQAMMFQLPELGLLSLAMAIPLISGGINLAIIATANQAALLMAWILTALMPPDASGADARRSGSPAPSPPACCSASSSAWSPACSSRSSACIRSWSPSAP